jgi:thiol-disulfide isomerase/thioredoxin
MFSSCFHTNGSTLPNPEIKDGMAKLSGKITNFHPVGGKDCRMLLIVSHPVTAENYTVTTAVSEDGVFAFEAVPMQCDYAIGYIRPEGMYEGVHVCLISGKEIKMDITHENTSLFKITNQTDSLGLTLTDLINMELVENRLTGYRPPEITGYAKTPDEFVQRAKISLNHRLKKTADNDVLSEIAKNFVANTLKLLSLNLRLLRYRENMQLDYLHAGNKDIENFNPQDPDKKYYTFLKDFDLNNPQYLYNGYYYYEVLQKILSNDTLNIPSIGDKPVDQWMKEVKGIMADLVGFDKGVFYDLLAANSYARQFNEVSRPLSNRQKENITTYFNGKKEAFAKILLKKNEAIEKIAGITSHLKINETPVVSEKELTHPEKNHPKGLLVDSIVARYKGKVVVIDFWNTWCAPCLLAMQTSRELKQEMLNKEVVFVYLADVSSPKSLWQNKIQGIGGEHYYLNDEEGKSISFSEKYGFTGIPVYLLFDTNGNFKKKITAYPGNDNMRKMIEDLLP